MTTTKGGRDPKERRAPKRRGARGESTSHTSLSADLVAYIEGLVLAQGRYAGEPFILDTWQKRFIRRAFGQSGDAGLSLGRGNGKTTFSSALIAASLNGPLAQPGAESVLVASRFDQGSIGYRHLPTHRQG